MGKCLKCGSDTKNVIIVMHALKIRKIEKNEIRNLKLVGSNKNIKQTGYEIFYYDGYTSCKQKIYKCKSCIKSDKHFTKHHISLEAQKRFNTSAVHFFDEDDYRDIVRDNYVLKNYDKYRKGKLIFARNEKIKNSFSYKHPILLLIILCILMLILDEYEFIIDLLNYFLNVNL